MDKLNPAVPKDLIITWDQVVERTPWVRKRLNSSEGESRSILRQPIPAPGEASELELATEAYYKQQVAEQFTAAVGASVQKSTPSEDTPCTPRGRGADLKAHVDKMDMGEGWTRLPGKQPGPDEGRHYEPPRRRQTDEDPTFLDDPSTAGTGKAPDRSPLTLELDPQSEVTNLLDYDDVVDQDPEILTAVANIPTETWKCGTRRQLRVPILTRNSYSMVLTNISAGEQQRRVRRLWSLLGMTSCSTTQLRRKLRRPQAREDRAHPRAPAKNQLDGSETCGTV